ncbi:cellulase [Burkholderia sp. WAC0059]|uniref:cellulose synthase complex periplasmic endoglucanase BcsZ n=1 Tax=Burkholderia sp. WAC0059 TaxID=2066022 RepID=UPI000C7F446C|nr:cellulose synthase complex periplasmic endoglucanase BcsZ [Burkholderia sp. WAC0059]PLZ03106.1 cellulase [Burkholderia sp. WAC0059]
MRASPWHPVLRRAAGALAFALAAFGAHAAAATPTAAPAPACAWPDWAAFKRTTLSPDGRVIDASSPDEITTSEGQSYALFFALVDNDRPTFDRVLGWTENNLAGGDLTSHLPAWLWGRLPAGSSAAGASGASGTASASNASSAAGSARQPAAVASGASATGGGRTGPGGQAWGVLDANPASDADLWIAYTLIEAGRLWNERRYTALGTTLARTVAREETASLPGLGRTVLPGSVGFAPAPGVWRLNPSYVPLQLIRGLETALPDQPEWKSLVGTSARLVNETAPRGFSPDWVEYHSGRGFAPDAQTKAESAYNAIRVYLWAGMLAPADPFRAATLHTFVPLADYVAAHGFPPERIDTQTAAPGPNAGNAGFSAAVVPYLAALGRADLASAQAARARAMEKDAPLGYYSSVLALFGLGFMDGLYRFDADGRLVPAWTTTCPALR